MNARMNVAAFSASSNKVNKATTALSLTATNEKQQRPMFVTCALLETNQDSLYAAPLTVFEF